MEERKTDDSDLYFDFCEEKRMNDPDATSHRSMMWQEDTIAPSKINMQR
jgi:hypothetical protein